MCFLYQSLAYKSQCTWCTRRRGRKREWANQGWREPELANKEAPLRCAFFSSSSFSPQSASTFLPYTVHAYIHTSITVSLSLSISSISLSLLVKNTLVVVVVVAGTIAPSRDLPELSAEDTIRIILSNLNLVVPVVAALLVIIIAIIVICILRSKGNHHKGIYKYIQLITNFVFFSVPLSLSLFDSLSNSLTLDTH